MANIGGGRPPNASKAAQFDSLPAVALVNVQTVAELLGTSVSWCWKAAKAGRIPTPYKIGAQSTGWRVGELRAFLEGLGK